MVITELEKARRLLDLTQIEVAELAGVNRATIIRAEAHQPPAGHDIRRRIARAVNSTADDLWPEDEEQAS